MCYNIIKESFRNIETAIYSHRCLFRYWPLYVTAYVIHKYTQPSMTLSTLQLHLKYLFTIIDSAAYKLFMNVIYDCV